MAIKIKDTVAGRKDLIASLHLIYFKTTEAKCLHKCHCIMLRIKMESPKMTV